MEWLSSPICHYVSTLQPPFSQVLQSSFARSLLAVFTQVPIGLMPPTCRSQRLTLQSKLTVYDPVHSIFFHRFDTMHRFVQLADASFCIPGTMPCLLSSSLETFAVPVPHSPTNKGVQNRSLNGKRLRYRCW